MYILYIPRPLRRFIFFFFFNATATTEIYTLSLHDALPISRLRLSPGVGRGRDHLPRPRLRPSPGVGRGGDHLPRPDRKSTRLNSSHPSISYAVFCLKKKKTQ